MRTILELFRILALLALFGIVCSFVTFWIYARFDIPTKYTLLGSIGILILYFVLYRNKLQFSGWYKGKGIKKLPKVISNTLVIIAIVLLLSPLLLNILFNNQFL